MSVHWGGRGLAHLSRWPREAFREVVDLTGFALLLEGGTDRILLEGDATDGDDILLLEGTA